MADSSEFKDDVEAVIMMALENKNFDKARAILDSKAEKASSRVENKMKWPQLHQAEPNGNDLNVRRGKKVHVESCIFLHVAVSCGRLQSVLRGAFVHHIQRYFHGTWI